MATSSLKSRNKASGSSDSNKAVCQLCGKSVEVQSNGKLRYHTCITGTSARPANQVVKQPEASNAAEPNDESDGLNEPDAEAEEIERSEESMQSDHEYEPGASPFARITKTSGSKKSQKVLTHFISEPDERGDSRSLCGILVPGDSEDRAVLGFSETDYDVDCLTCQAADAKRYKSGAKKQRRRSKPTEVELGGKVGSQIKEGKTVIHLVNVAANRTLCGSLIGERGEGKKWFDVSDDQDATCVTCEQRKAKTERQAVQATEKEVRAKLNAQVKAERDQIKADERDAKAKAKADQKTADEMAKQDAADEARIAEAEAADEPGADSEPESPTDQPG